MRKDTFMEIDGKRVMISYERGSTRIGHDRRATPVTYWSVMFNGKVIATAQSKKTVLERAQKALKEDAT